MAASRILVIDDEPVVLESVQRVLAGEDYAVEVTQSSAEGLEWGTERDYDLVITDIRMPDVGGMQILRDVKRRRPETAVLMLTGYGTVASAVQAMKLGASDYLEKPFEPKELKRVVQDTLARRADAEVPSQELEHPRTVLRVIQRAVADRSFAANLRYHGVDALDGWELNESEKLAVLTGDAAWIGQHAGELSTAQRKWLEEQAKAGV